MRLLVRSGAGRASTLELGGEQRTLELGGEHWTLDEVPMSKDSNALAFACVSYAWGEDRVPHPLEPARAISHRAMGALEAAVQACRPRAVWIDALCMPTEATAKAACLRQLGAIYARAAEVVVVLSESCLPLFEACEHEQPVDESVLCQLEAEPWVSRAWTYQELAGSGEIRFVVERGSRASIGGSELLNQVGEALWRRQQADPSSENPFPAVDNLMDVLASWVLGSTAPFGYQVLAGMTHRFAERSADRFNAALGAIAPDGHRAGSDDLAAACEVFMSTCEAKDDLSFLYCGAARSARAGRTWRPLPGELPPLVAWHTFGKGQLGSLEVTHVVLHDLLAVVPQPTERAARVHVDQWLTDAYCEAPGQASLAPRVLRRLMEMGFRGSGAPLELPMGFVFPLASQEFEGATVVLLATEVRWAFGAAALLVTPVREGRFRFRDVGVFVGPVPGDGRASFELE